MPRFGPITRKNLIQCLQRLGFVGPFSGGKHQFMVRDEVTIRVPNPHHGDIGRMRTDQRDAAAEFSDI